MPKYFMGSSEKKIYAVIETGGKQYKVTPGQVIQVERLPVEKGSQVKLDRVLLVADQDKVQVGRPVLEGATVTAEALGEEKGDKVIVFKYKPKVRYRRKKGHRQLYTNLAIKDILLGKGSKRRTRKSEVKQDGA
ncbi:50S ribosomal protein L21 [Chloroflexota bacterium]